MMILKLSHIHNEVYEFTYESYVSYIKMLNGTLKKIMSSKREKKTFLISLYGIISDFLINSHGATLYPANE